MNIEYKKAFKEMLQIFLDSYTATFVYQSVSG